VRLHKGKGVRIPPVKNVGTGPSFKAAQVWEKNTKEWLQTIVTGEEPEKEGKGRPG